MRISGTRSALHLAIRCVAAAGAIMLAVLAYTWLTLPDVRPLKTSNPGTTAFMELRAGEAAAAGRAPRRVQYWVTYEHISPTLKRAVLVTEDAQFWQHDGLDYGELRLALGQDWATGRLLRGASTLTQQLAKNLYLSPARNPYRKLTELFITRRLEAELSKRRIFELYLNVIEWGDGIWGAEAASRTYFGVSSNSLTADQAALLAAAIFNPHLYSPLHPNARLLRRQKLILARLGDVTPPGNLPSALPVSAGLPAAIIR